MRKIVLLMAMMVLLKARYTAVPDTDPEYAQGAIERTEVAHREVERFVWLFEADGEPSDWERRLNDAVDPRHGTFTVECATESEEAAVRNGTITLQR